MSLHPTPAEWRVRLAETQTKAARATKREVAGALDEAFDLYISSAQSYLFLTRHAPDPKTRDQLKAISGKLLDRAERIKLAKKDVKASRADRMSAEEQDTVLSRSSVINGNVFERARSSTVAPRTAASRPALSPRQVERNATWKMPDTLHAATAALDTLPTELVQDVVTDCSLVAGLVSAAHHHASFGSRIHLRALESGIDETLPTAENGELLCARTRDSAASWPGHIEKAYLLAMGGYNFAGSNSSTDLHALTGWIPEAIELKSSSFQIERTWARLVDGFSKGACLVTAGTGPPGPTLVEAGLIPSHDYAVIGLQEQADGRRTVDLYDAWHRAPEAPAAQDRQSAFSVEDLRQALDDRPGVFQVSYRTLRNYFDTLYLNWDPALFEHSCTVHSSTSPPPAFGLRFGPAPLADCEREVWVLLSRHYVHRDTDGDTFFALNVTADHSGDTRATNVSIGREVPAQYSNSMHILTKFVPMRPQASYLLTVSHRLAANKAPTTVPAGGHRFTMTVYSACPFNLRDAGPATLPHVRRIEGEWTPRTGGGHHGLATFGENPMWRIVVGGEDAVELRVKLVAVRKGGNEGAGVEQAVDDEKAVNVKVLVAEGDGRVFDLEERDVVADSGKYAYGVARVRCPDLLPGRYTIVPSTFMAGPRAAGPFELTIESSEALEAVGIIPQEGAGMYRREAESAWVDCHRGWRVVGGKGGLELRARLQALPPSPDDPVPPIGLSLFFLRRGADARPVATTGHLTDARSGCLLGPLRVRCDEEDASYVLRPHVQGDLGLGRCRLVLFADQGVRLEPCPWIA